MRIPIRKDRRSPRKKPTAEDVLRSELKKWYDIFPVEMPSILLSALADDGFTIMSADDLQNEIALAHQAGRDDVREGW